MSFDVHHSGKAEKPVKQEVQVVHDFPAEFRLRKPSSMSLMPSSAAMIDNVKVDDTEVRIHGRKIVLERLVVGTGVAPAGSSQFCW